MTKQIFIRPRANQDLENHFTYITQNNNEAALRFFDAVRLTIAQIAKTPGIGSPYLIQNPRLQNLRKWAVKDFRKYLIFYFERNDSIEIVRILYAARELTKILENEA